MVALKSPRAIVRKIRSVITLGQQRTGLGAISAEATGDMKMLNVALLPICEDDPLAGLCRANTIGRRLDSRSQFDAQSQ
jgi:hypothetical protein